MNSRRPEHAVNRRKHACPGAEGIVELDMTPAEPGPVERPFELPAHIVEFVRSGTLEREDRLFLVTHREYRTLEERACAGASREFRYQPFDNFPLVGACVLGFIDQDMIDAVIELIMNPGHRLRIEQVERLCDQVVIVKEAAPVLLGAVARDGGMTMVSRAIVRSRVTTA